MPEFLELASPEDALQRLLTNLNFNPAEETISTAVALGRVVLSPVEAPYALPSFSRSTVDGYAVRAADTFGASESLPAYFTLAGEVAMGVAPEFHLGNGDCALIHTGGMLPRGADSVVMLENTQLARPGEIELLRAAAVGENVLEVGEDVRQGQEVIPKGIRLRPPEIGGLMALGITRLVVARKPRVAILSSGDEVLPPEAILQPGQVYDVNSYTLSALVEENGGIPIRAGIVPDHEEKLFQSASSALAECEALVITAGSSASARDLTSQVVSRLGEPGVLVHGVNVRPGKPTILGVCHGKAVIGLPGNPVSALLIARLFVSPVIEILSGLQQARPKAVVKARLSINLASQAGREDWIPVRLSQGSHGYEAEPLFGKSNLIFTLVEADGLIRIPPDATGLSPGEVVEVHSL